MWEYLWGIGVPRAHRNTYLPWLTSSWTVRGNLALVFITRNTSIWGDHRRPPQVGQTRHADEMRQLRGTHELTMGDPSNPRAEVTGQPAHRPKQGVKGM